jgi:hypothetical protein
VSLTSGMSACLCLANTDLDMIGVKYSSWFSCVQQHKAPHDVTWTTNNSRML